MAFSITLYKYSKKENSTAAPSASTQGLNMSCVLKDYSSIINPVIDIRTASTDIHEYNYAFINEFKRYYYVTECRYALGVWQLTLSCDVLASWKTYIGSYNGYILRSTYDSNGDILFNGNIVDTKYPVTAAQATYTASSQNNPFMLGDDDPGTWVVGIINADAVGGSVTYYALTLTGFQAFNAKLFNSVDWLDIDASEISDNLQRALINPYQYVVSCMWFPINYTVIPGTLRQMKMGWWPLGIQAKSFYNVAAITKNTSVYIPRHPQSDRGNYLNLSPYSNYTLRWYPFGSITIDSEAIAGWNTLDLYANIDLSTGIGVLNVAVNGKNNPIEHIQTQIGVPIPTASMMTDYSSMSTGTLIGAGILGATQGEFFSALSNTKSILDLPGTAAALGRDLTNPQTIANIASAAQSMLSHVDSRGEQGNITGYFNQDLTLSGRFAPVAEEDFSHMGRPLCENRRIDTLSGFLMCADGDISIPCTIPELTAISSYLTGGFFYE